MTASNGKRGSSPVSVWAGGAIDLTAGDGPQFRGHSPVLGSVVVDASLQVVTVDDAFCGLLGYRHGDLLGRSVTTFVGVDDIDVSPLLSRPALPENDGVVEWRCIAATGEAIWARFRVAALHTADLDSVYRMDVVAHGTERRQLLSASEDRDERMRRLVDESPDMLYRYRTKPTSGFEFVSAAAMAISGYSPAEWYADPDLGVRVVHPDDGAAVGRLRQALTAPSLIELRWVRKDGSVVWVEHRSVPLRNDDGDIVAVEGTVRDVTERNRAQQEAQRRAAEVALLKDVAVAANSATNVHAALQLGIDRVCATTGWPVGVAYLKGANNRDLLPTGVWHLDDPAGFETFRTMVDNTWVPIGQGLVGEAAATGQATSRHGDDDPELMFLQACGLDVRAGMAFPLLIGSEVVGVLEFLADEASEPDEAMLHVMVNVGTALGRVVERERSTAERDRLDAAKTEFLLNAAHEMRNPVAALGMLSETIATRWHDMSAEQLRWSLDTLQRQGQWLTRLAGQLLDLSRLDEESVATPRREVDVSALVDDVVKAMPAPPGRTVTTTVPDGIVLVTDGMLLEQVLANLMQNAYRYGGNTIVIEAAQWETAEGDVIELSVEDNGAGLAPGLAAKVFEPFTRGEAGTGDGSGLGLALVRRAAQSLGGNVEHRAVVPTGARFTVRLPAR